MGNRAVVIFTDGKKAHSPCIYLHWNGGAESVYPFLDELDYRNVRADQEYEAARFVQIVGEFFDQDYLTATSLGMWNSPKELTIETLAKSNPGDNGIFIVNRTGGKLAVRRILEKYNSGETLQQYELTPKQVKEERKQAYAHKYNIHEKGKDTIAETFRKISKGKKTEAQHFKTK